MKPAPFPPALAFVWKVFKAITGCRRNQASIPSVRPPSVTILSHLTFFWVVPVCSHLNSTWTTPLAVGEIVRGPIVCQVVDVVPFPTTSAATPTSVLALIVTLGSGDAPEE